MLWVVRGDWTYMHSISIWIFFSSLVRIELCLRSEWPNASRRRTNFLCDMNVCWSGSLLSRTRSIKCWANPLCINFLSSIAFYDPHHPSHKLFNKMYILPFLLLSAFPLEGSPSPAPSPLNLKVFTPDERTILRTRMDTLIQKFTANPARRMILFLRGASAFVRLFPNRNDELTSVSDIHTPFLRSNKGRLIIFIMFYSQA